MVKTVLLIDTCTEYGFVAWSEEGRIVFHANLGNTFDSAQALVPVLKQQLAENGRDLKDIDLIGITAGPGSYTGLRVGAVIAKTLAFSLKRPLVAISSLELYVPHGLREGRFASFIDARMGGVYGAFGHVSEGAVSFESPFLANIDELGSKLSGIKTIVSPHAIRLKEKIIQLRDLDWHEIFPSSLWMMRAVLEKYHQGSYSEDGSLGLNYLRKTQAEIEREQNAR